MSSVAHLGPVILAHAAGVAREQAIRLRASGQFDAANLHEEQAHQFERGNVRWEWRGMLPIQKVWWRP